jgi:hypothetical protein
MDIVTYKMVGFDDEAKHPGQCDWQDIVYAGDDGRILALLGAKFRGGFSPGDWLQLGQTYEPINGYWSVSIRRNGMRPVKLRTHRLVLFAWRGPPFDRKLQGLHNDGASSNNRLENLRWANRR